MNPIKLMVRELTGSLCRSAVLWSVFAVSPLVASQEPPGSSQTNDAPAAQVLSQLNDLIRADDPSQLEDMAPPNDLAPTNDPAQSNLMAASGDRGAKSNRFDNPDKSSDDRRSRGRRSNRSRSNQRGSANDYSRDDRAQTNSIAGTNNGLATLDYASFKVIVDRNIFDPNRRPHRPGAPAVVSKPKSLDSLTLVGTMSYEKGTFAFFDGTSSEYKKALKLSDSIAGYKVTDITANAVKLASETNELELAVGAQLRREEDGPWLLASQSSSYATTPGATFKSGAAATSTPSADPASGGAESEIIRKLMQRREKE
jgi:hypothetical protein